MALVLAAMGCEDPPPTPVASEEPVVEPAAAEPAGEEPEAAPAAPLHPVPIWVEGTAQPPIERDLAAEAGYLVLDLGEHWTPYIFTESDHPDEAASPNAYRPTYLALAAGRFPDDHHGRRARDDRYLELYGIPPTLSLLRTRYRQRRELACAEEIDYDPVREFEGFIAYDSNGAARRAAARHEALGDEMGALARREGVSIAALDPARLSRGERRRLEDYRARHAEHVLIASVQRRLECEGFFEGKGTFIRGAMDWATHEALAEFERRHRIYGWGYIGRETLDALRKTPLELERDAVLRVLTERAIHAAGVLEDGSTVSERQGAPRFVGADGQHHEVRDLAAELGARVVESFGLSTPESVGAWLDALGEIRPHHLVAVRAIELPEYYSDDMDLFVEVDRGDVWYEFPYDAEGRERPQPVSRRPHTTIYTRYRGQRIALARFGTTIGGWRSDHVEGTLMWRYKGSPPGPRVWSRIIASPVWLPPDSSPPRGLLTSIGRGRYEVNYHETGPSYASAYGLVAAYHQLYSEDADGVIQLGGDQGIRMHGSVDYMSIMRRHSHGCHRLHNHIAVRLMSFVLAHRPHARRGQQVLGFRRHVEFEGRTYPMEIDQGGYVFRLHQPLPVEVLSGRILGAQHTPIEHPLPKYDPEVEAYVMPDGQWVRVDRHGNITPREMPALPDGGVPLADSDLGLAMGDDAMEAAEGLITGEDDQTESTGGNSVAPPAANDVSMTAAAPAVPPPPPAGSAGARPVVSERGPAPAAPARPTPSAVTPATSSSSPSSSGLVRTLPPATP